MEETKGTRQLYFDLGASETFVRIEWTYKGRPRSARHYFTRPSSADAEQYLKSMNRSQRAVEGDIIESSFDSTDADLVLWDKLIVRVEGYLATGLGDIMTKENWRELVPAPHKQAAAQGIFYLGLEPEKGASDEEDDGATFSPQGGLEVALQAMQNGILIKNLLHRFRHPKPSEMKEWNSMHAFNRVELRRKEKNYLFENNLRREIQLYDAMIYQVQGYLFNGGSFIELMDSVHKQMAITRAFEMVRMGEAKADDPLAVTPSVPASVN